MSDVNRVHDPAFWADRLRRGDLAGEPHRAVLDEPVEFWRRSNAISASVLRQVLDFWKPASVLDAGCGLGTLSEYVPKGLEYVGVDFSPELIAHARATYPSRTFRMMDCRALAFRDGAFDLVFCRGLEGVIKHAPGYGAEALGHAIGELLRVSRTVLVSMGQLRPGQYDVIAKSGARLYCVDGPESRGGFGIDG